MSEELAKYTRGKLERLDKYIPRADRPTALVEVAFREQGALKTCSVSVKFRREELVTSETTQHMYASLDIAAAAVEQSLKEYRQQHPGPVRRYLRGESSPK